MMGQIWPNDSVATVVLEKWWKSSSAAGLTGASASSNRTGAGSDTTCIASGSSSRAAAGGRHASPRLTQVAAGASARRTARQLSPVPIERVTGGIVRTFTFRLLHEIYTRQQSEQGPRFQEERGTHASLSRLVGEPSSSGPASVGRAGELERGPLAADQKRVCEGRRRRRHGSCK